MTLYTLWLLTFSFSLSYWFLLSSFLTCPRFDCSLPLLSFPLLSILCCDTSGGQHWGSEGQQRRLSMHGAHGNHEVRSPSKHSTQYTHANSMRILQFRIHHFNNSLLILHLRLLFLLDFTSSAPSSPSPSPPPFSSSLLTLLYWSSVRMLRNSSISPAQSKTPSLSHLIRKLQMRGEAKCSRGK